MILPTVSGKFDYVLILQWLMSHDEKTGENLSMFLRSKGVPSVLVSCASEHHIKDAINIALFGLPKMGVPIIHIEAHGQDPKDASMHELSFGTDAAPGLPWLSLGEYLRPLNVACGHKLFVVGATCFGMGVTAALRPALPAPFCGCVGFSTQVTAGSLQVALREFYRSLINDSSVDNAVENARRELRGLGEGLNLRSALQLASETLGSVYRSIRSNMELERNVSQILQSADASPLVDLGISEWPETRRLVEDLLKIEGEKKIKEMWDAWFPLSLQQIAPEYRFDPVMLEKIASS